MLSCFDRATQRRPDASRRSPHDGTSTHGRFVQSSRRQSFVIADEDENATAQWRGARVVAAGVRVGTDAVARRASRREDARRRERDRTAAVTTRAREA